MNKKLFKINRQIIFELDQNGKDELSVIASPGSVSVFLSALIYRFQNIDNSSPSIYFSWSYGKFDENGFNINAWAGQDQLVIITPVKSLVNFFLCLIVHFKENPEEPGSNYCFRYRGIFKQS